MVLDKSEVISEYISTIFMVVVIIIGITRYSSGATIMMIGINADQIIPDIKQTNAFSIPLATILTPHYMD